jgi:ribonuclease P/MRP protein subunit RPP1
MLADWTRGKNLIVSSGASNVNEVRGPNDVANLISFLLGLSKERAKAAISDNCRLVNFTISSMMLR